MATVPIIIPFYKEHEKLRRCRAAIEAQTYAACETFVRDNTHDNILFTAAVNEGLAKYCHRPDVKYVMVLNQDAYMHKDCVRLLVEFMDAHPECGIACPLQYQEQAPQANWAGGLSQLTLSLQKVVTWGGSLQAFPAGAHRCDPFSSYSDPFETYWANGACMMIRVQTVREIGVFDRNMRFICSDSDYSFTARARGWKVFVVPRALCQHALDASGKAANPEIDLVKVRDVQYFARKWLTGDVYRELALEGPELAASSVRQVVQRCEDQARTLEKRLGRRAASAADAFPSWTAGMQMTYPSWKPPMQRPGGTR